MKNYLLPLFFLLLTNLYPYCTGDINEDGYINVADVVNFVNIVLDDVPYDSIADLNFDENINIFDIVIVLELIFDGWNQCISVSGLVYDISGNYGQFTINNIAVENNQIVSGYDITVGVLGKSYLQYEITQYGGNSCPDGDYQLGDDLPINDEDDVCSEYYIEQRNTQIGWVYNNPGTQSGYFIELVDNPYGTGDIAGFLGGAYNFEYYLDYIIILN